MDSMRWSEEVAEPAGSSSSAAAGGDHPAGGGGGGGGAAAALGGLPGAGAGGGAAANVAVAVAGHPDAPNHHHHRGGVGDPASSSRSPSASAPTIKNHSVTHVGDYLFCFGGYDGRRNHSSLLLYDLRRRRWVRPIPVLPGDLHRHHHPSHHRAASYLLLDPESRQDLRREVGGEDLEPGAPFALPPDRPALPEQEQEQGLPPHRGEDGAQMLPPLRRHPASFPPRQGHGDLSAPDMMIVEGGDNEQGGGGGTGGIGGFPDPRRYRHRHGQYPSDGGGIGDVGSDGGAIYVFGNPPPGRNGHSATFAPNDEGDDDDYDEEDYDNAGAGGIDEEGGGVAGSVGDGHPWGFRASAGSGADRGRAIRRGGSSSALSSGGRSGGRAAGRGTGGRIIIIGGWLGTGPLAASDMHVLDVSRGGRHLTWYQPPVRGQPPGPCNMHSADYVRHLRSVYVFRGGNGREYLNDLHALDVDTYAWRPVETRGPAPQQRANHSSAVLDETSELFIFGGWNGGERLNDIHILNTATSTWTRPRVGGVLPHPRAGMTLTALRGRLYLFGGSGTSAKCFQDLQILDRQQMAWLDVAQSDDGAAAGGAGGAVGGSHHHHPAAAAAGHDGSLFRFGGGVAGAGGAHLPIHESHQQQDGAGGGDGDAMMMMIQADSHQSSSSRPMQDGSSFSPSALRQNSFRDWRSRDAAYNHGAGRALGGQPFGLSPSSSSTINPNDEDVPPTVVVHGRGPGRRAGHTATAVHRKIYVFGGSCGSDYLSDFYVLDTDPPPRAAVTESTTLQLLERRLGLYFNDPEFADVVFVVQGGHKVYGHKMILSMVSDCFRAMFTTGFRETSEGEIEIPDCTHAGFLALMEYVYTSRLPPSLLEGLRQESAASAATQHRHGYSQPHRHPSPGPAFARVVEVLELADRFFLDHLKQVCETLLQSAVSGGTVEYLLGVSQKTNSLQLQAICEHHLRNRE